jgi:5'-nucleotidase
MDASRSPLILFTNDDGIASPGLWAVVKAFEGMGELLVTAPRDQQSGMGRSLPRYTTGELHPQEIPVYISNCRAVAIDGTPAQSVQHGVLEIADRQPDLIVSGINYGDNCGNGVTISGTVGAAIEGASLGIRSIAVSLQTPFDLHLSYDTSVDFRAAAYFARAAGEMLLRMDSLPDDVDLLKIDVPWEATAETEWRITRLSRRRVYWPTRPERVAGDGRLGYTFNLDPSKAEPDSDVYTVMHLKMVSVTPMSLDMTARTSLTNLQRQLSAHLPMLTAAK